MNGNCGAWFSSPPPLLLPSSRRRPGPLVIPAKTRRMPGEEPGRQPRKPAPPGNRGAIVRETGHLRTLPRPVSRVTADAAPGMTRVQRRAVPATGAKSLGTPRSRSQPPVSASLSRTGSVIFTPVLSARAYFAHPVGGEGVGSTFLDGGGLWSSDEARRRDTSGVLEDVDGWRPPARHASKMRADDGQGRHVRIRVGSGNGPGGDPARPEHRAANRRARG